MTLATVVLGTSLFIVAGPSWAWNGIGHEVVARIAWNDLDQATKDEAVRLLLATRSEIELTTMRPAFRRRDRTLFERAATWPDYVRSEVPEESRPGWHYTNYFWKQEGDRTIDLPEMEPAPENVLTELPKLFAILSDTSAKDHDRGVALAWVLHLIGDMHQPLHCSARVTELDPRGDRGGNNFKLAPEQEEVQDFRRDNLHSLWDGALSRTVKKKPLESDRRYRKRLVKLVADEVSPTDLTAFTLADPESVLEDWVKEGFKVAKRACYPKALIRNQPASAQVLAAAADEARIRMALAGRRLARVLEELL